MADDATPEPDDATSEHAAAVAEPASVTSAVEITETAKEKSEKKRFPFFTIFTFIACCFGVLQNFKDLVEKFDHSIKAVAEALKHVDIFGLAGGYVDGLRLHGPSMHAGWAYPWEALFAGIQGMWGAMASGGWPSIVAGVFVVAIGLGAAVWALANTDNDPGDANLFSVAVLVILGAIVSVAVGFVTNTLLAEWLSASSFAYWVRGNVHQLGSGFSYDAPAIPYPQTLRELELFNMTPAAGPQAGDYHDAGAFLLGFIGSHGWFALETLIVGIIAVSIIALAASKIGGIIGTIVIPFAVLAVLVIGASVAYAIDHLILVPAISGILKIATISAAPIGLGTVAFILEKGHLAMSFFESGKKLIGKE